MKHVMLGVLAIVLLCGCSMMPKEGSFGSDVAFLKTHTDVIVLRDATGGGRVAVVPAYQGRVMTSSAEGAGGDSLGWINYAHIQSGELVPHINVFGGEDRFWMGPEGGQYAIFFAKDAAFDLEHWQTPAVIDTEPYDVVESGPTFAAFRKGTRLVNYSGTEFEVLIDRTIRVLDRVRVAELLGTDVPASVALVAYESENRLTNTGEAPWTKEGGLLSVWILGMFKHSPDTTVVVPFNAGDEAELGKKVNDMYFGKVPEDRLIVGEDILFFKGDGEYRSKIGIPPRRAKEVLGSYNESGRLLTIVQYTKPAGAEDYVNSMWELQDDPYGGDVVNSYNDGPPAPGKKPLGPFYELETSSPAAALGPSESITHFHRTFHFKGAPEELDVLSRKLLGVALETIEQAF
jgi:hypothetical protein